MLLVVGPDQLLEGVGTALGDLLRRGVALVPRPALEGRDGLPAVRRVLSGQPADEITLVLDAAVADGGSLQDPVVGVARAVASPAQNQGAEMTALTVLGWPGDREGQDAEARTALVGRILRIAAGAV